MNDLGRCLLVSFLVSTVTSTVLLNILGPDLQLGTATAELIDYSRTNTLGNNSDPRALLLSVLYPVVSDYEDELLAPYGQLGSIDYETYRSQFYHNCSVHKANYPVIIFSPGFGRTRLLYGALAQSVVKSGYIVVSIDHTYDADIVVFPDGKIIYGVDATNFTDDQYQAAVDTRVADYNFLLNSLANETIARELFPTVPYDFNVSEVAAYGHSMGGAALANAMITDERYAGVINMDGWLFSPITTEGLDKPFLLFGEATHTHFNDPSWNVTWPLLRGWHAEISLNGSVHRTFGDLAFLVKTLDLSHTGNESLEVGTVDGGVAMEDERVVITDFFNWIFHGVKSLLLESNDTGYPDISFVTDAYTPEVLCQ